LASAIGQRNRSAAASRRRLFARASAVNSTFKGIVRVLVGGTLCALATLASFASAAEQDQGAGVYKWTDKNGRVHYSDMPPPKSVNAVRVKRSSVAAPAAASAKPGTATAAPKSYVEQEVEFRKRRTEADEAAKAKAEKQQQADQAREACAQSRGRLRSLEQGGRVVRYNDKGESEYLDDKGFKQEIANEKKYLNENCSS
jgi:hypothetical protein